MEYQVKLDTFQGPLDLLLYLVKRNEIDIFDIPVSRIADQFLEYLRLLELIDVEQAGEFLVMAATLMEIKSRLLLPRGGEAGPEEADPRLELVRQLVEYKKFKDAAALLDAQAERQLSRLPRLPVDLPEEPDPARQPLRTVELWDLVSAFGRLMRETLALQPQQIVMDHTPLQVYVEQLLRRLGEEPRLPFSALFTPPYQRARLIGLFLALLEMMKARLLLVEQPEPFGEMFVRLPDEATPAPPPVSSP